MHEVLLCAYLNLHMMSVRYDAHKAHITFLETSNAGLKCFKVFCTIIEMTHHHSYVMMMV